MVTIVLLIAGLVVTGVKGRSGMWWLPAGPLVFAGFFSLAIIAKQLELGAYREEPMVPFPPPIANRVVFKSVATEDQINHFWTHIIGYPTDDKGGHWSRPGVASAARTDERIVTFAFREEATEEDEEEKNDIRARIRNYPPISEYYESVTTSTPTPDDSNTTKPNTRKPKKSSVTNSDP